MLNHLNLILNESKTKEYKILWNRGEEWKKCKLLGFFLERDIDWRKGLSIGANNNMKSIFD